MKFELGDNNVATKIIAFILGISAACLLGFIRPGFVSGSSHTADSVKSKSAKSVIDSRRPTSEQILFDPAPVAPVVAVVSPAKLPEPVEPKLVEGPLERFQRNLLVASASGEVSDVQYLANQLDLFAIRGTPRFREDVLAADPDFAEIKKLAVNSSKLSRAAARFLGVSAADSLLSGNSSEAKRLLGLSEQFQPGLDLQRTVRSALLRGNTPVRTRVRTPAKVNSADLLALDSEPAVESIAERVLSFLLSLIMLAIFILVGVFAFVFYRRTIASSSGSAQFDDDAGDSGYIGKIRRLVVVPGKRNEAAADSEDGSPPEDEPAVKLKRAA